MNVKSLITGLVIGVFVTISTITLASSNINLIINDQKIETEVPPKIKDGRTLVPIRVISEELGYNVDWDGATRSVIIEDKESNIDLKTSNEDDIKKFEEDGVEFIQKNEIKFGKLSDLNKNFNYNFSNYLNKKDITAREYFDKNNLTEENDFLIYKGITFINYDYFYQKFGI